MALSFWGEAIPVAPKKEKEAAKNIVKKVKEKKQVTVEKKTSKAQTKKLTLPERLELITAEVYRVLGVYKENTIVLDSIESLHSYIDKAIENGIIAVDTETNNSLDPITCKIMGGCIYTPGMKNAYIPVNHVNPDTNERLVNQVTEQQLYDEFSRLNNTQVIMHNGKFDYAVLKCTCGLHMRIDWDTLIAAKILDENEMSAGLKQQYIAKIDSSIEKYNIEHLFKDVEYAVVDPAIFALYAATDSYMTYKLYEWQKKRLELPENARMYNLFKSIEMPLVEVISEMEMAGMMVDQDYASLLSAKYHKKLDAVTIKIDAALEELKPTVASWRETADANYHPPKKKGEGFAKSKNEQLTEPVNVDSPTQLAILLYDVLKAPVVNKKSPRGTGEEEIKAIKDKLNLPLCDLILERRKYNKLISTYIDSIPELATRWPDGRVRTHFNQYGAATGRLSSSDPLNFQNIPSHDKLIRLLFCAANGNRIVGGDFSQQEPKLTAHYSGDENMINAYLEGKDLYAIIASRSFNMPYDDCLEFYPEGTEIEYEGKKVICGHKTHQNKAGKERRSNAKSILLGVLYGRGATSVGEQIGKSTEEAQKIIDAFFQGFPKVKQWIDGSMQFARDNGYVEDVAGRRRRLPDIKLPKYTVSVPNSDEFNPLLESRGLFDNGSAALKKLYEEKLSEAKYRNQINSIIEKAKSDNVEIKDNGGFIAQAERQAVNSRVQGGAATLTKVALNLIYRDQRLRDINAKLINTVHDEILLEVPEEYSELAEKYLQEDMVNSAKEYVPEVPMKCDTYNVNCWYEENVAVEVQSMYENIHKEMNYEEAVQKIVESFAVFSSEKIKQFIAY